jgi:hypothetical protein
MVACNTDWTGVIASRIFMVMRYCHESGKKEKQYKRNYKAFIADHGSSFKHAQRLAFADQFVKTMFVVPTHICIEISIWNIQFPRDATGAKYRKKVMLQHYITW